jgi:hypothetical protein
MAGSGSQRAFERVSVFLRSWQVNRDFSKPRPGDSLIEETTKMTETKWWQLAAGARVHSPASVAASTRSELFELQNTTRPNESPRQTISTRTAV